MRVLIVKTSALGDIIHCFSALSYLAGKSIDVDWVVEASHKELLQAHPDVSGLICVDTKGWKKNPFSSASRKGFCQFVKELRHQEYDVVLDLQGNTKSAVITFLARAKVKVGFGYKTVPEWPNLLVTNKKFNPPLGQNISRDYLSLVEPIFGPGEALGLPRLSITDQEEKHLLSYLRYGRKVLVSPGAAWLNKVVPLSFLIHQMEQQEGHFYLSWGSEQEKQMADSLHAHFCDRSTLLAKLSLPSLQNFMAKMDLIIAMDSLPLHLAATTGVSTLSFFGPSSKEKYKPEGAQHVALQGRCPYGQHFVKRCSRLRTCRDAPCIKFGSH